MAPPERLQALDEDERELWLAFMEVAIRAVEQLDRELQADHGLSLADYEILAHLSEAPERRLQMTQLAEQALLSQSRLTYRVDRLVRQGFVERVPCATDGRRVYAQLTKVGFKKLESSYPGHLAGVRAYVVDPPAPRDRAAACRAMNAMLDALRDRQA